MSTIKYEPLFSRLTWGNGTCAEFIGDKAVADELGAEMVARWNNQEPDVHTRKAWAAIERQNAEIKALRAIETALRAIINAPQITTSEHHPLVIAARAAIARATGGEVRP